MDEEVLILREDEESSNAESDSIPTGGLTRDNTPMRTRTFKYKVNSVSSSVSRKCSMSPASMVTVGFVIVAAVMISLAIGLVMGERLGRRAVNKEDGGEATHPPPCNIKGSYDWGDTVSINGSTSSVFQYFTDNLRENDIRDYLATLTASPHIAGSDTNRDLAVMMAKEWKGYGFDSVELVNYTVLLSYPNKTLPNTLRIIDSMGVVKYDSHISQEPPLTPQEDDPDVVPPFNAYSGSGNVTGPLVYVNYARSEDFLYLTNGTVLQLDLTEYICIARYQRIFRGDKAHLAQTYGCRALLIFSDPHDYAPEGEEVYPNGNNLPPYGVQRGTLALLDGDLLTPGTPAIPGMFRRPYEEVLDAKVVPRIPVQPMSYGDAIYFMKQLSEYTPPDDWVGGLEGLEYKIAQAVSNENMTELVVNNYQVEKMIHNVVAKLYGGVEPDRQVILGNHRDAWVFGAVDPNSGTSIQMALAKVIGQLRLQDWRPGRTIVLCSWDAEEYGLIGSTEWVEDFGKQIEASTVAYLNVDEGASGSRSLQTSSNPLLYEISWLSAKMVACPNPEFQTVYDEWFHYSNRLYKGSSKPEISHLGSGSDFTAFLQSLGLSCTSLTYYTNTTYYAVYHSVHDNFYWMTNFGDPTFTHHRASGLVWITQALLLTTSPIVPSKPTDYSFIIEEAFRDMQEDFGEVMQLNNVTLDYLSEDVTDFGIAAGDFEIEMVNASSSPNISQQLNLVRIINDKLMNIERAFIHPEGLPGRPYYKHVVFAPSSINSYSSAIFPGITDTIFNATHPGMYGSWEEVKKQIDIVRTHIRYATQIMKEPSLKFAPRS